MNLATRLHLRAAKSHLYVALLGQLWCHPENQTTPCSNEKVEMVRVSMMTANVPYCCFANHGPWGRDNPLRSIGQPGPGATGT